MRRHRLPSPHITIDGKPAPASTQLGYAGPYSVTLSTALPGYGLELHSAYLGHEHTPTLAGHLALAPQARHIHHVIHEPGELPVAGSSHSQAGTTGRSALLLDHLAELRNHITAATGANDVRVSVDDAALRDLNTA